MTGRLLRASLASLAAAVVVGAAVPALACDGPMMGYGNTSTATDGSASVGGQTAALAVSAAGDQPGAVETPAATDQSDAMQTTPALPAPATRPGPERWMQGALLHAERDLAGLAAWMHTLPWTQFGLRV